MRVTRRSTPPYWPCTAVSFWACVDTPPRYSAASYMPRAVRSDTGASGFSRSRRVCARIACVVARFPAERMTSDRSPGNSRTCILLYVRMSSTPALVRVSDANTRPSFTWVATQYIIRVQGSYYRIPAVSSGRKRRRQLQFPDRQEKGDDDALECV